MKLSDLHHEGKRWRKAVNSVMKVRRDPVIYCASFNTHTYKYLNESFLHEMYSETISTSVLQRGLHAVLQITVCKRYACWVNSLVVSSHANSVSSAFQISACDFSALGEWNVNVGVWWKIMSSDVSFHKRNKSPGKPTEHSVSRFHANTKMIFHSPQLYWSGSRNVSVTFF